MLRLFSQMLAWLRSSTWNLVLLAGFLVLLWGMLAPVGTLVWWLNQSSESLGFKRQQRLPERNPPKTTAHSINCYVVFLTGVGDYSVDQLTPGEEFFLDRLEQLRPNCVTVRDVFPYSAANKDLAGDRFLAPLWDAAEHAEGWLKEADVLIKIRNLWRFAISADDRYGKVYNQGIADAIVDRMNAAHPISTAEPLQVILIGTSGGAQVALGAVPFLEDWLNARLIVISAGGAFDGEAGFAEAEAVYHLQGKRDWVEDIPRILFPSRWSWTVGSPINRARREGRYRTQISGPHTHDGPEGYFGTATEPSSQMAYVELTLEQVNQLPFWSSQSDNSHQD
ncbi:hypothetical protein HJG54_29775 [Leptolyngbya sp. NK1-12]|uniref:Uncharacterized protein n=1 Tax=Leptolyngbya sp. NK1-12 TaxID=2547451 RepID=A0AA96WYL4_9CYAN|nr:hypothetical protein [Leptolyngbya sp. NK1-12]WNZ27102.1 hypothetical protein HJG54_29775 [Leptolyngbya sp. NK1-12]